MSASLSPLAPAGSRGVARTICQSAGKSCRAMTGAGRTPSDAEEGRKSVFSTAGPKAWPPSMMNPPCSKAAVPIPDVPPRPAIRASSFTREAPAEDLADSPGDRKRDLGPAPEPDMRGVDPPEGDLHAALDPDPGKDPCRDPLCRPPRLFVPAMGDGLPGLVHLEEDPRFREGDPDPPVHPPYPPVHIDEPEVDPGRGLHDHPPLVQERVVGELLLDGDEGLPWWMIWYRRERMGSFLKVPKTPGMPASRGDDPRVQDLAPRLDTVLWPGSSRWGYPPA